MRRLGETSELNGDSNTPDSTTKEKRYLSRATSEDIRRDNMRLGELASQNTNSAAAADSSYSPSDFGGDVLASAQAGLRITQDAFEGGLAMVDEDLAKGFTNLRDDVQSKVADVTGLEAFTEEDTEANRSDIVKAQRQEIQDAEGFVGTIGAASENPLGTASYISDSLLPMAATAATAALVGAAGVPGVIAAAGSEGALMMGTQAKELAGDGELTNKDRLMAGLTGLVGAGAGALGGKIASKVDAINPEQVFQGKISNIVDSVGMTGFKSAVIEGGEETVQSSAETIFANIANDKPILEGVPKSAAMGLVTGTAMGAGSGLMFSETGPIDPATGKEFQNKQVSDSAKKLDNLEKLKDTQKKAGQDTTRVDENIKKTRENLEASKKKDKGEDGNQTDAKSDYNDEVGSLLKAHDKIIAQKEAIEYFEENIKDLLDIATLFEAQGFTEEEASVLANNVMEKYAYSNDRQVFKEKIDDIIFAETSTARRSPNYFGLEETGDTVVPPEGTPISTQDVLTPEQLPPIEDATYGDLAVEDARARMAKSDVEEELAGTITAEDEAMLAEDIFGEKALTDLTDEEVQDLADRSPIQVEQDIRSDNPVVAAEAYDQKISTKTANRESNFDQEVDETIANVKSQVAKVKAVKEKNEYSNLKTNISRAKYHATNKNGLVDQIESLNKQLVESGLGPDELATGSARVMKELSSKGRVSAKELDAAIKAIESDIKLTESMVSKISEGQTPSSAAIHTTEEQNVELVEKEVEVLKEVPEAVSKEIEDAVKKLEALPLDQLAALSNVPDLPDTQRQAIETAMERAMSLRDEKKASRSVKAKKTKVKKAPTDSDQGLVNALSDNQGKDGSTRIAEIEAKLEELDNSFDTDSDRLISKLNKELRELKSIRQAQEVTEPEDTIERPDDELASDAYFESTQVSDDDINMYGDDVDYSLTGPIGAAKIPGVTGALVEAKKMSKDNVSARQIYNTTGWFQEKISGDWKFEINDREMSLQYNVNTDNAVFSEMRNNQSTTLDRIIKHPTLFKMYPELAKVKLTKDTGMSGTGLISFVDGINIRLNYDRATPAMMNTLIHEIQHYIQSVENFSRGGSPTQFTTEQIDAYIAKNMKFYASKIQMLNIAKNISLKTDVVNRLDMSTNIFKEADNIALSNDISVISQNLASYDRLLRQYSQLSEGLAQETNYAPKGPYAQVAYKMYKSLLGEMEARDTATRRLWTDEQRRSKLPLATEDRPDSQKLMRKDGDINFSLVDFHPDVKQNTTKLLDSLDYNTKAKNKTMFVNQKMNQLKVNKAERAVVEDALSTLDPEGKGKYDWVDLKNAIQGQLADASLITIDNHRYKDYGLDNIMPSTESSKASKALDGLRGRIERAFDDSGEVVVLQIHNGKPIEVRLQEELQTQAGFDLNIISKEPSGNVTKYSFDKDQYETVEYAMSVVSDDVLAEFTNDDVNSITSELRLTEPGKDTPITFQFNPKAEGHDLSKEAVLHIRSFERDGVTHVVEIQSDLKQIGSKELYVLQSDASPSANTDETITLISSMFLEDINNVTSNIVDNLSEPDKLGNAVYAAVINATDHVVGLDITPIFMDISSLGDDLSTSTENIANNKETIKKISDYITTSLGNLREVQIESEDKDAIAGLKALNNPHWLNIKPTLELRAFRETVANESLALSMESKESGIIRLATPDTIQKVEGWDTNIDSHKSLKSKYAKTAKTISKEFSGKEVTDEAGTTWIEIQVPTDYVPVAFSLTEAEPSGPVLLSDARRAFDHIESRVNKKGLALETEDGKLDFSMKLVPTQNALPKHIRPKGMGAKGVYDRSTNTVWVVANAHSDTKGVTTTIAHELIGHVGLRKVLGKKVDALFHRLLTSDPKLLADIVANVPHFSIYMEQWLANNNIADQDPKSLYSTRDANGNKVDIPFDVAMRLADEYMANLAGDEVFFSKFISERVGRNKSDRSAKSKKRSKLLNQFLDKVIHQLRKVFGMTSDQLSRDDLLEMLAESVNHVFTRTDFDYTQIISKEEMDDFGVSVRASALAKETAIRMGAEPELVSKTTALMVEGGFGQLNKRWNEKQADKLGRRIKKSKLTAPFFALGNLNHDKALSIIESKASGNMVEMRDFSMEFNKVAKKMNSASMAEVMLYFTTQDAAVPESVLLDKPKMDAKLKEMLPKAKQAIADLGENLVGLGLLDSETYLENKGTYLQTRYVKYLLSYKGSKSKPSFQNYLKQKDPDLKDMDKERLGLIKDPAFLVAESIGVMSRDIAIVQMYNTIATVSKDNSFKWILGDEGKVIDAHGNKIRIAELKKTISHQEDLIKIHEDASTAKALNFSEETYHIISKELADNVEILDAYNTRVKADVTRLVKKGDSSAEPTQEEIDSFINSEYREMPAAKRYGSLAGELVRKEIYDSLIEVDEIFAEVNGMKMTGKLVKAHAFFKWAKVAANPTSHFRNFMSNGMMLDMGTDTNFVTLTGMLVDTAQSIAKRGKGDRSNRFLEYAIKGGLSSTTMSAQELSHLGSHISNAMKKSEATSLYGKSMAILNDNFIGLVDMTSKYFGLQETMFKTVALQDHIMTWEKQNLPKGQTIEDIDMVQREAVISEAIWHANKTLLDYSKVNSTVGMIRRMPLGSPFLTYMYKSFPVMVENFAKRPHKMATYMAMPSLAALMVMAGNDWDDEDMEEFEAKLPLYHKNSSSSFVLPFKNEQGLMQMINMDYVFPPAPFFNAALKYKNEGNFSSYTDAMYSTAASAGSLVTETYGFLGGPLPTAIVGYFANEQAFSKRPIRTEGAPAKQQMLEYLQYSTEQMIPPWMTSTGIFRKLHKSLFGYKTYDLSREQITPTQAGLSFAGLSVSSADPEAGQRFNALKFGRDMTNTKKAFRAAMSEAQRRSYSPEEIAKIQREYTTTLKYQAERIKKYQKSIGE